MITKDHKQWETYKPMADQIDEYVTNELMGMSEHTQRNYYYALHRFFEYLLENHIDTFPSFSEREINGFMRDLEENRLSPYYANVTFAAINHFSQQVLGQVIKKKLVNLPKLPDLRQLQPKSLVNEKVEAVEERLFTEYVKAKEKAENPRFLASTGKVRDHFRNYVLFRVMVQCALRIGETLALDFDDIVLSGKRTESRYIHIRKAKGNKERKVPLSQDLAQLLEQYIAFRKNYDKQIELEKMYNHFKNGRIDIEMESESFTFLDKHEQLEYKSQRDFLANSNEQTSGVIAAKIICAGIRLEALRKYVDKHFNQNTDLFISNRSKRLSKEAAMKMFAKFNFTSHQLRHTAIKTLIDNKTTINRVQALTGHSSADMILRYSKPSFEEIQGDLERNQRKFKREF